MTISYSLNSNSVAAGVGARWDPIEIGSESGGLPRYNSAWYRHIWTIDPLDVTTFLILQALRGAAFASLITTGQSDPNTQTEYTTGEVTTVTGRHEALWVRNVRVEFLVDTS